MNIQKRLLSRVVLSFCVTLVVDQSMAQTEPVQQISVPQTTVANDPTQRAPGLRASWCGHVIDLMMKNRFRQQMNATGYHGEVHLPHLSVGIKPGDLELLCVHLVCDGSAEAGPVFQIQMQNNSQIPIGNFQVSVVGLLGQIHPHAPTAIACVQRMEPGQVTELQIQLPVTCMAIGLPGHEAPFDTLIVAVDSYDELLECDELNNVQILKRCDIVPVVTSSEPPVNPGPAQITPVPTTPLPRDAEVPAVPDAPKDSPLDRIDVDQLDIDQESGLRIVPR